jgi:hypothetical protein
LLLVPVLLSGPDDPAPGLFRLETSVGRIVVLFRSHEEFNRFASLYAPKLESQGELLGFMETPYTRVSDVIDMLVEQGTSRRGEEMFIPDDHPLYQELIKGLSD